MNYALEAGTLIVRDGAREVWRGRPDGLPVKAVSPIEGSDDAIVMLDYMSGPKNFANLLRIAPEGAVNWRATPPDQSGSDAYVEFRWDSGTLMANSWSGHRVQIDLSSGCVTRWEFTK